MEYNDIYINAEITLDDGKGPGVYSILKESESIVSSRFYSDVSGKEEVIMLALPKAVQFLSETKTNRIIIDKKIAKLLTKIFSNEPKLNYYEKTTYNKYRDIIDYLKEELTAKNVIFPIELNLSEREYYYGIKIDAEDILEEYLTKILEGEILEEDYSKYK